MPNFWDGKKLYSHEFDATSRGTGNVQTFRVVVQRHDPDYGILYEDLKSDLTFEDNVHRAYLDRPMIDIKRGHLLSEYKKISIEVPVEVLADFAAIDHDDFTTIEQWYEEDEFGVSAWDQIFDYMYSDDVLSAILKWHNSLNEAHKDQEWYAWGKSLDTYSDNSYKFSPYCFEDFPIEQTDMYSLLEYHPERNEIYATVYLEGRLILDDDLPSSDDVEGQYVQWDGETENPEYVQWFTNAVVLYIQTCNGTTTWDSMFVGIERFSFIDQKWELISYQYTAAYEFDWLYDDENLISLYTETLEYLLEHFTYNPKTILWDSDTEFFVAENWCDPVFLNFDLSDLENIPTITVNDIEYSLELHTHNTVTRAYILINGGYKYDYRLEEWIQTHSNENKKVARIFELGELFTPGKVLSVTLNSMEVYRIEAWREKYPIEKPEGKPELDIS